MDNLDKDGQKLLALLVEHMRGRDFKLGQPHKYITYKRAHELLGLRCLDGMKWGHSLQEQGLNNLAGWTK